VVTENLYVGNKVLTFRDNIYVEHNVKDQYFEFPGRINLNNAVKHILETCVQKKNSVNFLGREYVIENYSDYTEEFKQIF
jgi:hypothetical protein